MELFNHAWRSALVLLIFYSITLPYAPPLIYFVVLVRDTSLPQD